MCVFACVCHCVHACTCTPSVHVWHVKCAWVVQVWVYDVCTCTACVYSARSCTCGMCLCVLVHDPGVCLCSVCWGCAWVGAVGTGRVIGSFSG